jgi:hypothetical protein
MMMMIMGDRDKDAHGRYRVNAAVESAAGGSVDASLREWAAMTVAWVA